MLILNMTPRKSWIIHDQSSFRNTNQVAAVLILARSRKSCLQNIGRLMWDAGWRKGVKDGRLREDFISQMLLTN